MPPKRRRTTAEPAATSTPPTPPVQTPPVVVTPATSVPAVPPVQTPPVPVTSSSAVQTPPVPPTSSSVVPPAQFPTVIHSVTAPAVFPPVVHPVTTPAVPPAHLDGNALAAAILVDGSWSSWSPWSACNVTCGSGSRSRLRVCDKPAASNGGKECVGEENENQTCDTEHPCTAFPGSGDIVMAIVIGLLVLAVPWCMKRIITSVSLPFSSPKKLFIVHGGEDKYSLVEPLVREIVDQGFPKKDMFYDKWSIGFTQGIKETIASAIHDTSCKLAVIVISEDMEKKYWPRKEFEEFLKQGKAFFPIFYGVTPAEVRRRYSPTLADTRGVEVPRTGERVDEIWIAGTASQIRKILQGKL